MRCDEVIARLKQAEPALRARGIRRAAVFGSVARGEEQPDSDIDIMIELDPNAHFTVYDYVGLKEFVAGLFEQPVHVAKFGPPRPETRSMPSKRVDTALQDILDHIELAERFVGDLDWPTLHDDTRTFYAVVRCLEIIPKASRRLPAEFKGRYASIPWSKIAAAGNVYRHDYDEVETRIVWDTVKGALPELRSIVENEKTTPKRP